MKNKENVKMMMAVCSFVTAIVIGFIALYIPPQGIIDASVLWFTAQLLVFTSTLLGLSISMDNLSQKAHNYKNISE